MIQANRIGRRHLFSATCSAVFLFTLSAVSSGVEPLPVGPAISPDAVVACPIGLMGLFGQPTQEQCTQLDLSSCSQEVRNTCRSLTLAANIAAQRNGFVNGGEPITCPIASGTEPNLATCQNPFTFVPPLCSNDIIATCRSLLETEFLRAEAEKSVTDAIAPDVWSFDRTKAVTESHKVSGSVDFNSYASVQRWSLEVLAEFPNSALIGGLRDSFEANQNRVESCLEYVYESNYSLSRALDEFAKAGFDPNTIYDSSFKPGGIAAEALRLKRDRLEVISRNGNSRGLIGTLGHVKEYPLGPLEGGVHTHARHLHQNAYADAVYLGPILMMFADTQAGPVTDPSIYRSAFNDLRIHRNFDPEPGLAWHRDKPAEFSQKRRVTRAVLDDGSVLNSGYIDHELNEEFTRQQQFLQLLTKFIQKAPLSSYFEYSTGGGYVPHSSANNDDGFTYWVTFKSAAQRNVSSDYAFEIPNADPWNSFAESKADQLQAFNSFMASHQDIDIELRGLLSELIAEINQASVRCGADWSACNWSKASFADRLQQVLVQAEYPSASFPANASPLSFVLDYPNSAETEYQQCIRVLPNLAQASDVNRLLSIEAAKNLRSFCARGGAGLDSNGNPIMDVRACENAQGTYYALPIINLAEDVTANSSAFRDALMKIEYYRQAAVVYERERRAAALMAIDASMVGPGGSFQAPTVSKAQGSGFGNRDFAAVDYDYGFKWKLGGSANQSLCEFKPGFDSHIRASVYLLGHRYDFFNFELEANENVASSSGGLLDTDLFVPQDDSDGPTFNIVLNGPERSADDSFGTTLFLGPVPIDLRMGAAGVASAGGHFTYSQTNAGGSNLCEPRTFGSSLDGKFAPNLTLNAFASAGVGGEVLGVGASAGVRGDLTLVGIGMSAGIHSVTALPVGARTVDDSYLDVDSNFGLVFQSMSGSISAYLRISYLVGSSTWKKELVGWPGITESPTWKTHIDRLNLLELSRAMGAQ